MRTLSASLTTAQESILNTGGSSEFIWKVVLSLTGETTRGYDRTRILSMPIVETEDDQHATVLLKNSDNALTTIDFEYYTATVSLGYHTAVSRTAWQASNAYSVDNVVIPTTVNGFQYRCVTAGTSHSSEPAFPTDLGVTVTETGGVVWEMDGNTSDEYSTLPPFKVIKQRFLSGIGTLVCQLNLIGTPNEMKLDLAEAEYIPNSSNTDTVKTIINAIADTTLNSSGPYGNYSSVTTSFDSEDNLIDSYKPADYFRVGYNNSRWDKIGELLSYTGNKMRVEADGKIHFFDPVISGSTYDYEYKFRVSGSHVFSSKELTNRFVSPNKVIVKSSDDHSPSFTGSKTSATSFALAPKTETLIRRLVSNAEALNIATARQESYELGAERGAVTVPMNVGQEVWDYIKVTDSQQGDSKEGNVRRITRNIEGADASGKVIFDMSINFGTGVVGAILPQLSSGADLSVAVNDLIIAYNALNGDFLDLAGDVFINAVNVNALINRERVPKWHVTEQLIIPVET